MKKYEVEGHAFSLVPEEKNWKLVWSDEFDGTELDMTKWSYRLNMMGKRHITWTDGGVSLDGNSNAVFRIYEKDGEICSSQLQTGFNYMDQPVEMKEDCWGGGLIWPIGKFQKHKFLHKYGYYECRCKLQKKKGWWSAFWVQSPTIGCSPVVEEAGVENDIMESFQPGEVIVHANHTGGYGPDHICRVAGTEKKGLDLNEYHTFGMMWTKDRYTFYVDGVEDGHVDAPVSQRPEFILISTEVDGYRSKAHTATDEARQTAKEGDEFIVDYVRVFDEI